MGIIKVDYLLSRYFQGFHHPNSTLVAYIESKLANMIWPMVETLFLSFALNSLTQFYQAMGPWPGLALDMEDVRLCLYQMIAFACLLACHFVPPPSHFKA